MGWGGVGWGLDGRGQLVGVSCRGEKGRAVRVVTVSSTGYHIQLYDGENVKGKLCGLT